MLHSVFHAHVRRCSLSCDLAPVFVRVWTIDIAEPPSQTMTRRTTPLLLLVRKGEARELRQMLQDQIMRKIKRKTEVWRGVMEKEIMREIKR